MSLPCRRRRTGGPFSAQARYAAAAVTTSGDSRVWDRVADSGRRAWYHWCPDCGATVFYRNEGHGSLVAVPISAFDGDPTRPTASIFERHRRDWLAIVGDGIDHVA